MTSRASRAGANVRAPSLRRRMACFLYEGVLLFGVLMLAGYLYSTLTQQRHALIGRHGLQGFVFVVLAAYYSWFWSHGGQTVAMKAWRIRVVTCEGAPLTPLRALSRYLLAWLWFLPALLWIRWSGIGGLGPILLTLCGGVISYSALALLHPERQFWHDAANGTRLTRV